MKQRITAYTLVNFPSVKVICGILGKLDRGNFELIGRSEILTSHKIEWKFDLNSHNKTTFRHFHEWCGYLTEIGVSVRLFMPRTLQSIFIFGFMDR